MLNLILTESLPDVVNSSILAFDFVDSSSAFDILPKAGKQTMLNLILTESLSDVANSSMSAFDFVDSSSAFHNPS